eukprot:m.294917 g.294917  ORF g.294917 m.294917 type:complete len:53 (+) comp51578_c0_seq1:336-494(+)
MESSSCVEPTESEKFSRFRAATVGVVIGKRREIAYGTRLRRDLFVENYDCRR